MVHQYVWEGQETPLEHKYGEFIAQVKDRNERMQLVNKIVSENKPELSSKNVDLFQSFKPNAKFIDSYNKRTLLERKATEKEEYLKSFNENGKALANVYNQSEFQQIHDPLSNNLYFLLNKFF